MNLIKTMKNRIISIFSKKPKEEIIINLQEDYYNVGFIPPLRMLKFQEFLQKKIPDGKKVENFLDEKTRRPTEPDIGSLYIMTYVSKEKVMPIIITQLGTPDFYIKKDWWDLYQLDGKLVIN